MIEPFDPRGNQLLAALPVDDLQRWLPDIEVVDMPLGEVISEPGRKMTHVYFPSTSIVSLLYVMEDGLSAEIAVVGRKASSAFPSSWEASRHRAARSCRVPAPASG